MLLFRQPRLFSHVSQKEENEQTSLSLKRTPCPTHSHVFPGLHFMTIKKASIGRRLKEIGY